VKTGSQMNNEIMEIILSAIKEISDLLDWILKDTMNDENIFIMKLSFLSNYIYQQRKVSTKRGNKRKLEGNEETKNDHLFLSIDSFLSSVEKYPEPNVQTTTLSNQGKSKLDPIVYLNVQGERTCILKSTLFGMIPESQLFIRLASGRWEEPEQNYDEDGNIIIDDIPKKLLKALIRAIREKSLKKADNLMLVTTKEESDFFRPFIDYLLIENVRFVIKGAACL
jgi:hypothetical protein